MKILIRNINSIVTQNTQGRHCLPDADKGETDHNKLINPQESGESKMETAQKYLKLAQINLQNNKTATNDFIKDAINQNYSIACTQDTALTDKKPHGLPPSLPYYSSNSNKCHIIILNTNLQHIQVQKNNNSVFINIIFPNEEITIGSQYSSPSADLNEHLQ